MTNILCVSLFDNGGSLQQLSNAINKYTDDTSIHLNYQQTWLDYDVDIAGQDTSAKEIKSKVGSPDFFIFSELVPPQFKDLNFKLERSNTILRCFGAITRNSLKTYREYWSNTFVTMVSGGFDPTIHPYLGFVAYHIPNIYEFSDFPKRTHSNKLKICHAATNEWLKDANHVKDVFLELEKNYDVETVMISKVPWKETLKIKATCDITVDQFILGTYASSSIESMYLEQAVVSRISPFVRSMHPDLPIIQSEKENLYSTLENLIQNPDKVSELGEAGKNYASKEHDAERNISKWTNLIEWVKTGFI